MKNRMLLPLSASLVVSTLAMATGSSGSQGASEAQKADAHEMHSTMTKMQKAMDEAPMTGDADRDFVQMMIPHHQGAIDMARVYLKSGKNPKIRAMAEKIIKDQEKEIRDFRAWLDKKAPSAN